MKKGLAVFLTLMLAFMMLAGCSGSKTDPATIRIGGLKGPTSMGLVKLMDDAAQGKTNCKYDFTIAAAADELTPALLRGEMDMAAVPANLAAVLYNNSDGAVQVLAVNTLGVLYIVQKNETIASLNNLKGKTIYATGKGTTPEYTLRYLLASSGIDPDRDVTIEFKSEPTEVAALLQSETQAVAMLPQPYVTSALASVEGLEIALDLTEEWDKLDNGSKLITGVMVVRKEFADQHKDEIKSFLKEYETSAAYANSNPAEAAVLIEANGIAKAAIAEKAIPQCNITCISGDEMKEILPGYLQVLFDQNPKAVGAAMPADDFYWK